MTSHLPLVETADRRIRPYVPETPVRESPRLAPPGVTLILKEEQRLPTGSFKLRGAFHAVLAMSPTERAVGVVAASSGNHGAAVAHAADRLEVRARIFVPQGASPAKLEMIRAKGATVIPFGTDGLDTEIEARAVAWRDGATYVSPYNDPLVVAGQGTLALELLRQTGPIDRLYVAVGGGGLIAGIATVLAAHSPSTQIIGALPEASPVMAASVMAGKVIEMPTQPTLSDGTAGGIEKRSMTFPLCRDLVHRWVLVSEEEIATAMHRWAAHEEGMIEGAAGVALAAMYRDADQLAGQRVAVIICGGNITEERWRSVVG